MAGEGDGVARQHPDVTRFDQVEGLISNFQRTLDGYLAGLPYEQLIPAMQATNTTIGVTVADFDLGR